MVNPYIGEPKRQNENPKIAIAKKTAMASRTGWKKEREVGVIKNDKNNKDLLYSIGNYIQYLVRNYNGTESEQREFRYIHIYAQSS